MTSKSDTMILNQRYQIKSWQYWDFPGGPVVKILCVQSLVTELRFRMLNGMAILLLKKKNSKHPHPLNLTIIMVDIISLLQVLCVIAKKSFKSDLQNKRMLHRDNMEINITPIR